MRWLGHCLMCQGERDVESRPSHAMKALCDECAVRPAAPPTPPLGPTRCDGCGRITTVGPEHSPDKPYELALTCDRCHDRRRRR